MTENESTVNSKNPVDPWRTAVPGLMPPGPPLITQRLMRGTRDALPNLENALQALPLSPSDRVQLERISQIAVQGAFDRVNSQRDFEDRSLYPSGEVLAAMAWLFSHAAQFASPAEVPESPVPTMQASVQRGFSEIQHTHLPM